MEDFLWVEKYRPKTIRDCILPDELKKTFGELDPAIKHKISHRNLAFKKLKTEIKKIVHE